MLVQSTISANNSVNIVYIVQKCYFSRVHLYTKNFISVFKMILDATIYYTNFELFILGVWPVLSRVMEIYASDSRIMERTCRTLRFVIRCIGTQSAPLVEPLVQRLVRLYIEHPHSCFLYLVSFLKFSDS